MPQHFGILNGSIENDYREKGIFMGHWSAVNDTYKETYHEFSTYSILTQITGAEIVLILDYNIVKETKLIYLFLFLKNIVW